MTETWDAALTRLIEANKERGEGIRSFRQLWLAMPGDDDTTKRSLNRIKQTNRASEKSAVLISQLLGVPRDELPPRKSWRVESEARLEELEETVARAEDVLRLENVLTAAIRFLANGDVQAALRVLPAEEAQ